MSKTKTQKQTVASILRAGGHPIRVKIIELIKSEGEISVNDVVDKINVSQSLTSHHLMILRKAGYIKKRRDGRFIFYSINSEKLYGLLKAVEKILDDNNF